jgi:hypothetical protein
MQIKLLLISKIEFIVWIKPTKRTHLFIVPKDLTAGLVARITVTILDVTVPFFSPFRLSCAQLESQENTPLIIKN